MARLHLLGGDEVDVVQGMVISVEPSMKLCALVTSKGEVIASRTMPEKDAKAWATKKCKEVLEQVGTVEAMRLGYTEPMELRVYQSHP